MSTRSHYTELESADERQISPREGVDKSVVLPKASSLLRQSTKQAKLGGQLFQNMVFVVSFLPKKQSKQSRQQERIKLETRITEAGGTILSDGFDFLFEESPIMGLTGPTFDKQSTLTILPQHMGAGFTALIADSHSRTPKYMQALALGLPCLAHQWVDRCLDKAAIVDWEPYALCAGASPLLGNALHSRNLAGFDATEAQLAAIIEKRRRLLDGQRVLAVMGQKKGRGEAKQHHLFLAQALGPVISRVFSEEQAKEALAANVKAGTPFDWVYVDAATGTANSVLGSTEADGKKRKRKRGVSAPAPAAGQTRALYDELIIQSLILGRMLDQDEATFLE